MLDGVCSSLFVLMVVLDEVEGGATELFLEPQELPKKSLPALGSHNFGTFGGTVGRGVMRLGEDVVVKMSVG